MQYKNNKFRDDYWLGDSEFFWIILMVYNPLPWLSQTGFLARAVTNFWRPPRVASPRNFARARVYFDRPTIAIAKIRDYSQSRTIVYGIMFGNICRNMKCCSARVRRRDLVNYWNHDQVMKIQWSRVQIPPGEDKEILLNSSRVVHIPSLTQHSVGK